MGLSSRNLKFRLKPNTEILITAQNKNANKQKKKMETFKSTYVEDSIKSILYNNEKMSANQWANLIKKKLGHSSGGRVNIWKDLLYVLIENENGEMIKCKLRDLPVLERYKRYEEEILNDKYAENSIFDKYLNESDDSNKSNKSNIDNMPRGRPKKQQTNTRRLVSAL